MPRRNRAGTGAVREAATLLVHKLCDSPVPALIRVWWQNLGYVADAFDTRAVPCLPVSL